MLNKNTDSIKLIKKYRIIKKNKALKKKILFLQSNFRNKNYYE
jgi:hypothetical protein